MPVSRAETVASTLVTEFTGITIANSYRNDVQTVMKAIRDPKLIEKFSEIQLEFGKSVIKAIDQPRTTFDELIDVHLAMYNLVETEPSPDAPTKLLAAQDIMIHDLKKKICTDLLKKYAMTANNYFTVELTDGQLVFYRFGLLGHGRNIALIETMFVVKVRHQDSTFDQ